MKICTINFIFLLLKGKRNSQNHWTERSIPNSGILDQFSNKELSNSLRDLRWFPFYKLIHDPHWTNDENFKNKSKIKLTVMYRLTAAIVEEGAREGYLTTTVTRLLSPEHWSFTNKQLHYIYIMNILRWSRGEQYI